MSAYKRFLEANQMLQRQLTAVPPEHGVALIEANQAQVFYLYSILKIGIIFAHLNGLRPRIYPSVRSGRKQRSIIHSLSRDVVKSRLTFFWCVLTRLPSVLLLVSNLKTKRDVAEIQINDAKIGVYIFDAIYRPMVRGISGTQRLRIIYLLLCHWMDRTVLERAEVKLVIIGDPAHRCGMLLELCRTRGIKCISAINPDIFQMHKYYTPDEFERHFRDVPESLLSKLVNYPEVTKRVDDYLAIRFRGAVRQHDVIRAYGSHKVIHTRDELINNYGLNPSLPIVFIMAHVFSDAPHTYPGTLYTDYEEWLTQTVLALARNPNVNFLVKEHPTADLYHETGMVRRLLESIGQAHRLLRSDVHTQTVLSGANAIITCGGTIGMEASVRGIPIVLAARPPYAGKGYTTEPSSLTEYETLLEKQVQHLRPLTDAQIQRAKYVAYVMFELFDNDGRTVELGGVPYVWGQPYDEIAFFRGVVAETSVPAREQRIYKLLADFHHSADTSLINYSKLSVDEQL